MDAAKKCPECGYENETEARFCANCGNPLREAVTPAHPPLPSSLPEEIRVRPNNAAPLQPEATEQQRAFSHECPKCHYPAGRQDLFCRRCGAELVHRPLLCPRCGDPVDADEKFCNRCGLALG